MDQMRQMEEMRRAGLGEKSLPVRELRRQMRPHEDFIGKQFQALSPEEQKQQMPAMQAIEQQRGAVEEEELRRRQKLNKELGDGDRAVHSFISSLASNNVGGMAAAGVGIAGGGALATTLVGAITHIFRQSQMEYREGGATLSPSGADTEKKSKDLRQMEESRQSGELNRQRAEALMEQRRRQAMQMGLNRTADPMSWLMAPFSHASRELGAANQAYVAELARTGKEGMASAAKARRLTQYYEEQIRARGGKPEEFQQNFVMPVQGGISNALAFQSKMQVAAFQATSQSLDAKILQEQLTQLHDLGRLLERIANNTSENLNPRWGA